MSNTIRMYKAGLAHMTNAHDMTVTATMQGKWGAGVQFTISDNYIVLAENQVKDLITVLQKRLNRDEGFSATDIDNEEVICPEELK